MRSRCRETLREQVLAAAPDRWTTAYAKVSGSLPLDELAAAKQCKVLYIQGELNVSTAGRIRVRPDSPEGIRFWIDDVLAPAGTREFISSATPGVHTVTVRVEPARSTVPRDQDGHRQAGRLRGRVHGRRRPVK